jgi:hypothetical protein
MRKSVLTWDYDGEGLMALIVILVADGQSRRVSTPNTRRKLAQFVFGGDLLQKGRGVGASGLPIGGGQVGAGQRVWPGPRMRSRRLARSLAA